MYGQLQSTLAWRTPVLTDTSIKRTLAKSPAKTNYGRLTEINCCYYGLSLKRTRIRGPYSVRCESTVYMKFGVVNRQNNLTNLGFSLGHGELSYFSNPPWIIRLITTCMPLLYNDRPSLRAGSKGHSMLNSPPKMVTRDLVIVSHHFLLILIFLLALFILFHKGAKRQKYC